MRTQDLRPVQRCQLQCGSLPEDLIAAEVEDAREELMSAMKLADTLEQKDIHGRLARIVLEVDDLRAVLSERGTR